jgi:hypothetical protein
MLTNPFAKVTVGSTVDAMGNFAESVFKEDAHVTTMTSKQTYIEKSMMGQSDIVYTSRLNQGSISMSGSYGFSGLSKVSAAVSAYAGFSRAESGKTVTIDYQIILAAGVEEINYDALTPKELLGALKQAPQETALLALTWCHALTDSLKGRSLLDVLADPDTEDSAEVRDALDNWAKAVDDFRQNYGDATVVAVAWGGIGRSNLTFVDKSAAQSWRYGGTADFTYGSATASVSVGMTYDASGSDSANQVTVNVLSIVFGNCVKPETDSWESQLQGKALEEVMGKTPLQADAPDLNRSPPDIPSFEKPAAVEADVAILTKESLTDLAKIDAYNRAKALWDKAHPNGPGFQDSLDQFLAKAAQNPDPKPMQNLQRAIAQNRLSTLESLPAPSRDLTSSRPQVLARAKASATPQPATALAASPNDSADYFPVGLWVAPWSDLFPWLASGVSNTIDDTSTAATIARFRMMQQDFLALGRIYQIAADLKLSLVSLEPDFSPAGLQQIADNFYARFADLAESDKPTSEYPSEAAAAFARLAPQAQHIYRMWNQIHLLRNCELGLGLIVDGSLSLPLEVSTIKEIPGASYAVGVKNNFSPRSGNFDDSNFDAFSRTLKLLPLILPSVRGGRPAIAAFGPGGGVLSVLSKYGHLSTFLNRSDRSAFEPSPVPGIMFFKEEGRRAIPWRTIPPFEETKLIADNGFLVFAPDAGNQYLENRKFGYCLYPIPFRAARGISWKGQSLSTNLKADESLNAKLEALADSVAKKSLAQWSYSGESLPDGWDAGAAYKRLAIHKQYFGLIPEPGKGQDAG